MVNIAQQILDDIDRTIAENLNDPDLASKPADYKDGYARGMREAFLILVSTRLKTPMETILTMAREHPGAFTPSVARVRISGNDAP